MNKPLTFLLSLTFLFLFSGSVYGDDFQDGVDAHERKDYKTAYQLWLPLAQKGNAGAQTNLGLMYSDGQGVPQDYKEAVRLYRLAVEQGDAGAQNNLGSVYSEGKGVPQDYKEAVKWIRLAAEQELVEAQYNLAKRYYQGLGVSKDYVLAHMWVNLAVSNGHEDSIEKRTMVEKAMTPQLSDYENEINKMKLISAN